MITVNIAGNPMTDAHRNAFADMMMAKLREAMIREEEELFGIFRIPSDGTQELVDLVTEAAQQ